MSRIGRQFSWVLAGRLLAAGIQAVTMLWLARIVGPRSFGLLAAVLGATIVCQAIADLGISRLLIRERGAGGSQELVVGGLRVNSQASAVLGVSVILILCLLGVYVDEGFFWMAPLGVSVACEKNADARLGVVLADGDAHLNTANLVGRRLAALFLFAVLVAVSCPGILAYSSAVALAAVGSAWFARRCLRGRTGAAASTLAATVRAALPYWANTLAMQFRNLDSLVVGLVAGTSVTGQYAAAARLTGPLRMLPTSLAVIILPYAARTRSAPVGPLIRRVCLFAAMPAAINLMLTFAVPWIVPAVLGGEFKPAIVPIRIVMVGLVFAGLSSLLVAIMQGRGRQTGVALVSTAATMYVLLAVGLLSWKAGAVGAALGLASGFFIECLMLGLLMFFMEFRSRH